MSNPKITNVENVGNQRFPLPCTDSLSPRQYDALKQAAAKGLSFEDAIKDLKLVEELGFDAEFLRKSFGSLFGVK